MIELILNDPSYLNYDIKSEDELFKKIEDVINYCLDIEKIDKTKMIVEVFLEDEKAVHKLNKQYRDVDKTTDVLSFPMYEKDQLDKKVIDNDFATIDVMGSIILNMKKIDQQAKEYNHSFTRELLYLLVHGFYHIRGYDHIDEKDKIQMRKKEEYIMQSLNIIRG